LVIAGLLLVWAHAASAQTADDIVERHLTAIGGRAALGKLKSRSMTGTVTFSTPVGEFVGPIEILNQEPNKSRVLIKVDLSSVGAGQMTVDQRFNGTSAYVLDSLQGNRDITGNQLENMKNGSFPSPFLNYKEKGVKVELGGREKVGERDAYVLILTPKIGSGLRLYLDAESYLPLKQSIRVDAPQLGGEVEQTTEFLDYRDVDGVKVPFQVKTTSPAQSYVVTVTKVEHNGLIDEALFSKPPAP
jgi:hypothetical protein